MVRQIQVTIPVEHRCRMAHVHDQTRWDRLKAWVAWAWAAKMDVVGLCRRTVLGEQCSLQGIEVVLLFVHILATRSATKQGPVGVNCHCHSVILFPANTKCGYQYPCTPSLRPERIKGMFNLSYCKHSASWMPRSCRRKLKGPRKPQPNQP